jgi:lipoate-protein ligase A
MNEAYEEATLLARHQEQTVGTIRVWQNESAVLLGNSGEIGISVNEDRCKLNNVTIVRRASSGKTIYQDHGTLNLTYVINQKNLFPETDNLTEIYRQLCEPVAYGISKFGVKAKVGDYGQSILAEGKRLCDVSVNFYYDLVLFGLSININTNMNVLRQVLKQEDDTTTLSTVLGRTVSMEDAWNMLLHAITGHFRLTVENQNFTPSEENLAKRLYEIKYSKDEWTIHGKAPLSLRDVLVDLYVAYPPTRSCKEIIENVNSAITEIKDKVELRIWMHGRGLNGQRCPPGVIMTGGLIKASKESIIPAIIINGEIAFSRDVPSKGDLRNRIVQGIKG